jgi:hypothetical protein
MCLCAYLALISGDTVPLTTFVLHLELLLLPMETEKWKLEGSNVKSSRLPDKKMIGKRLVWVVYRFYF